MNVKRQENKELDIEMKRCVQFTLYMYLFEKWATIETNLSNPRTPVK